MGDCKSKNKSKSKSKSKGGNETRDARHEKKEARFDARESICGSRELKIEKWGKWLESVG